MSGGFGNDWRDKGNGEKDAYDTAELFRRSSDAFNKIITDSTSNTLDLPSGYKFSPERYRFDINSTRFRDIDGDTRVSREESSFLLQPDQNDKITFFSAERPRYVVGYEAVASGSFKINTTVDTGDKIRFGINDFQNPENAAFFEINGGDNRVVLKDQGTEHTTQNFTLPDTLDATDPIRWEIKYNWYGVGRYLFTINYSDDTQPQGEKQQSFQVAELVRDDDYSNSDPIQHLFTEIETSNTGKEIEVGSFGFNVLGDVIPTSRVKTSRISGASYGGSGDYEAMAAFKVDSDFGNIFTQVKSLEVTPDTTEGEALAIAVESSETDASNFSTPVQHSSNNSIVKESTGGDVTTFPNESGSVVTSASNPNGRQVGFGASDVSGQGSRAARSGSIQRDKRPIYEDDVVVILYKADTATSDSVNIVYQTEQFW